MVAALKSLKSRNSHSRFNKLVVGIITNSDDRVPAVLSSFGLDVSDLRYGVEADPGAFAQGTFDIDFHCMSYDVGVEKPDKRIFAAADSMLQRIIAMRQDHDSADSGWHSPHWQRVYVGDEHAKDIVGALDAGWNPVLLDTDNGADGIVDVNEHSAETLDDLFEENSVVKTSSIENLTSWLTGRS
ncbi:hypothetical protein HIM_08324 [Hirsutella minnesotensis 3608]|uniref:Uncharacterized protein n=1 Tax=Hirsutella minnesotensis 3608 TaxID=1043627 RepID=A0A0F7ZT07_9HYPO|nr:hypothetical protein HIM_08324 [Hirsutella minnesotensis 3608]